MIWSLYMYVHCLFDLSICYERSSFMFNIDSDDEIQRDRFRYYKFVLGICHSSACTPPRPPPKGGCTCGLMITRTRTNIYCYYYGYYDGSADVPRINVEATAVTARRYRAAYNNIASTQHGDGAVAMCARRRDKCSKTLFGVKRLKSVILASE